MKPRKYKEIINSLNTEFAQVLKDHCYSNYYVVKDEDVTPSQIFTVEAFYGEEYIGQDGKVIKHSDFVRPVLQFQCRGPWKNECFDINEFFRINDEVMDEFWELRERGELDLLIPILRNAKELSDPKDIGQSEVNTHFFISIDAGIVGGTQFLREILKEGILCIGLDDQEHIEVSCVQSERKKIVALLNGKPTELKVPFDKIPKVELLHTEPERIIPDPRYIFVIMSFQDDPFLEDAYSSIKRAVSGVRKGLRCERVDEIQEDFEITDKVIECIQRAGVIIADLTGSRPNVYYELGYARAIGKTLILTAREGEKVHFDIRNVNTIFYKNSTELERKLKLRLRSIFRKL
jgi:hypothetical protein